MSDVTLRAAIEADIPSILALVRDLAEYERDPEAAVATPELMRDALFGENAVAYAILAELDGTTVGFALYFFNFSTWTGRPGLYLEDLYVKTEARGLGIGRKLFVYLAQVALDRGCGRLELSVLDWNASAIGFYEKLGGIAMDGWTVYRFTPDAIAAIAATAATAPVAAHAHETR